MPEDEKDKEKERKGGAAFWAGAPQVQPAVRMPGFLGRLFTPARTFGSLGQAYRGGLGKFAVALVTTPVGQAAALAVLAVGGTFVLAEIAERSVSAPEVRQGSDAVFPGRGGSRPDVRRPGSPLRESSIGLARLGGQRGAGSGGDEERRKGEEQRAVEADAAAAAGERIAEEAADLAEGALAGEGELWHGRPTGEAARGGSSGAGSQLAATMARSSAGDRPKLKSKSFLKKASRRRLSSRGIGRRFSRRMRSKRTRKLAGGRRASGKVLKKEMVVTDTALSQLKYAHGRSEEGRSVGGEGSSAAGTEAFEQQNRRGTGGAGISQGGGGRRTGPSNIDNTGGDVGGGGGGGGDDDEGGPIHDPEDVPEIEDPEDKTPYDDFVKNARDLNEQAAELKRKGVMFIALGMALIAAGLLIAHSSGWTGIGMVVAIGMIFAGLGSVAYGMMQVKEAKRLADEARALADRVEGAFGQDEQADIIRRDADAAEQGRDPGYSDPAAAEACGYKESMSGQELKRYSECMGRRASGGGSGSQDIDWSQYEPTGNPFQPYRLKGSGPSGGAGAGSQDIDWSQYEATGDPFQPYRRKGTGGGAGAGSQDIDWSQYEPTGNPFQPYRLKGTKPDGGAGVGSQDIDWSQYEATGDPFQPYRPKTTGPMIHVPSDNPFQPYQTVDSCPPGTTAVVTDWPRQGDMGCQ